LITFPKAKIIFPKKLFRLLGREMTDPFAAKADHELPIPTGGGIVANEYITGVALETLEKDRGFIDVFDQAAAYCKNGLPLGRWIKATVEIDDYGVGRSGN
jgi:hypothetical protein